MGRLRQGLVLTPSVAAGTILLVLCFTHGPSHPVPHTHLQHSTKLYFAALLFFPLGLFIAMGYTWQALDEEEFPDSELPGWFVRIFRGRRVSSASEQH